jgi:hypothetical protein
VAGSLTFTALLLSGVQLYLAEQAIAGNCTAVSRESTFLWLAWTPALVSATGIDKFPAGVSMPFHDPQTRPTKDLLPACALAPSG